MTPCPPPDPSALLAAVAGADPVVVLTGHYGVGKTNLALNLALAAAQAGESAAVADLDLVNPYFRSSDYPDVLTSARACALSPPPSPARPSTPRAWAASSSPSNSSAPSPSPAAGSS